jgi:DNA polymerase (family 10)
MPVHNNDIAKVFEEIADLLELEDANPFRVRAYRNAARTLRGLGTEISQMIKEGRDLTDLPGIGADLAGKIAEVAKTGSLALLKKLRREFPPALTEMLQIPGLGPKRVQTLYHELDIHTLPQLRRAAKDGRIRSLPGFGAKTEKLILEAATAQAKAPQRFKLATAAVYAESLAAYLQKIPGVDQVTVAGSFRRMRETVGDLDIVVTAGAKSPVMEGLTSYDEVKKVVATGPTKTTVILRCGLQVDVRLMPKESYGAALYYFTGSKAHNIAVRSIAQKRGLKINEYGVFKGEKRVAGETEESVFKSVGLNFIPPELRENRGEIEAAAKGKLPRLIELSDLKGDLHIHTTATDGSNSIREMALAAKKLGLDYIAITEHSHRLTMVHGLDAKALRKQMAEIDRLNGEKLGIALLKGIEVDILEDGKLDLPDEVLAELDLVVGAIHSKFNLSRAKQTDRILRAMNHPSFTIFAHPSGRLISEREAYDVDMAQVIAGAKKRGCFLELNAHPERLDLTDVYCQAAKSAGVLVSINSDAHGTEELKNLRFGVGQARRGWLERSDVLNTRPLQELRALLRRTMRS